MVLAHPAVVVQSNTILDSNPSIDNSDIHLASGVTYAHETFGLLGAGQTVAVIDSGIAYDHPALGGGFGEGYRVVGGWDFSEENDADPFDDAPAGFHGTHVAGIVGSSDETHRGIAPEVDFVALRVFNDAGRSNFAWVENALQWVLENKDAFENPITTVNLSMGSDSHRDDVPEWSTLEDELLKLREQGIFVTAAAGNDFANHGTTGLNYPASSPSVVAVSSHDIDNQLSDFSQRSSRALVAPGEHVTSTVSDFIYDFNGKTDDFASTSGTSMASPYLAGASILVREALDRVNRDASPDSIYAILRDTATPVYDANTRATYHHLNVQAAVDSILQRDDFGSTPLEAHSLGILQTTTQIEGRFDSTQDVDYFSFTPTRTGVVSVEAFGASHSDVTWVLPGGQSLNGQHSFDLAVNAGSTYTVGIQAANAPANFDYDLRLGLRAQTTALGTIDWADVDVDSTESRLYEITTQRTGLLSIVAEVESSHASLLVYDDAMNPIFVDSATHFEQRVAAGERFFFEVAGDANHVPVKVANLVSITRDGVKVYATDAKDEFRLTMANSGASLSINGVDYELGFRNRTRSSVTIVGSSRGDDTLRLTTSTSNETVTLDPHRVSVTGGRHSVSATGLEKIYVYAGNRDSSVEFGDSRAFDTFTGLPAYAVLESNGYFNYAAGFSHVTVSSLQGGEDKAIVYDSEDDDLLVGAHDFATLSNDKFEIRVEGFQAVEARGLNGGNDLARIYDSPDNDLLNSLPSYTVLEGNGRSKYVSGFERVQAYAINGGDDTAKLFDSAASDAFYGTPQYGVLEGNGFRNYAQGFEDLRAYASNGGEDLARLYGSSSNDTYFGLPTYSVLTGSGFRSYVDGFEQVRAYGQGGVDQAKLFGSSGNEQFYGLPEYSVLMGDEYHHYVRGFEDVQADARSEGTTVARFFDAEGHKVFEQQLEDNGPGDARSTRLAVVSRSLNAFAAQEFDLVFGELQSDLDNDERTSAETLRGSFFVVGRDRELCNDLISIECLFDLAAQATREASSGSVGHKDIAVGENSDAEHPLLTAIGVLRVDYLSP